MAVYEVQAPDGTVLQIEGPEGASEESILSYAKNVAYPAFLSEKKKPEPQQSVLRQVADVPLKIGAGAVQGVRMIADAFGAGSAVSENLKGAEGYIESLLSAQSKKDSAEIARIMDDAKDKGVYDQVVAAVNALKVAPIDLVAQGLGTMAPTIIGGLALRVGAPAVGVLMGAGTIKGAIYDETKKVLMEKGVSPGVADEIAQEAQSYDGKNIDQILIGAGLGVADALTGASRILTNVARQAAGKAVAEGVVKEVGRNLPSRLVLGAAGEAPLEALQGGQEQLAQNLAIQREGFERPTFQGVAGQAALEGLVGGITGGAARGAFGRRPELPPVLPRVRPGEEPPPAPAVPPATPGLTPPSPPGAPPGAAAAAGPLQTPASIQNVLSVTGGAVPATLQGAVQLAQQPTLPAPGPTTIQIPTPPPISVPGTLGTTLAPTSVTGGIEPTIRPLEPVTAPPALQLPTLPRDLAGAKPRYSIGGDRFELSFGSDIDKALFITAQLSKSKRDADYRKWLTSLGYTPSDITRLGSQIRTRIKRLAQQAPGAGSLQIEPFTSVPASLAAKAQTLPVAPAAAPTSAPKPVAPAPAAPSLGAALVSSAATAAPVVPAVAPTPAPAAPPPTAPAPSRALALAFQRTPEEHRFKVVKTGVQSIPEIETAPLVVELSSVISSEVPGYDPTLQPRDRTRTGSDVQIADIVAKFDPQLLTFDLSTKRGAPIVNENMNVESGNGRIMALRRIYESQPALAEAYKAELTRLGFDISGMNNPVLVQRRATPLTPEETQAYVSTANKPDVMQMGASELAKEDAKKITVEMLDRIPEGRDYTSQRFVYEFLRKLPANELNTMLNAKGELSPDGERRIRNAVFAKAFGDSQAIARIAESTDDNIRSISNALIDNLVSFAKLRVSIDEGKTDPGFSTDPLIDAINRISQMRNTGTTLENYLSQVDAFNPIPPMTEKFMRLFYSERARALGRAKISDGLGFYAREALKVTPPEEGLGQGLGLGLGLPEITPMSLIDAAIKRAQGVVEGQGTMALQPPAPAQAPIPTPAAPPVTVEPVTTNVVTPAVAPLAITVTDRKRINLGPVDGTITRVTFSDGTAVDIQRMDSASTMGLPGWHDLSKSAGQVSYLGDTEKEAIARLLEQKNAQKFVPKAAPVGTLPTPEPTDLGPSNQPVIVGDVPQSVKDSTVFKVSPGAEEWLNRNLPGVDVLLRELQYRLYPGTEFEVALTPGPRKADDGPFGGMSPAKIEKNIVKITVNPERLAGYFGSGGKDYRSKLLHTLFHEMSHPIQYFWINNADVDTQAAIFEQFNKERSGTAAQRAGLIQYFLDQKNPKVDVNTLRERLLKAFDLTDAQFKRLLETTYDITSASRSIYRLNFSDTYYRKYEEWVAEKGAQWLSKELEGRLPKNVFEKFQKEILTKLRSIYETVAKLLGIPTSTGAFEQLLSDIWGVKKSTPAGIYGLRRGAKSDQVALTPDAEIAYEQAIEGNNGPLNRLPGADTARLNSERFTKLTNKVREFFDPRFTIDSYPILSEYRNRLFGKIGMSTQRARDISNAISKGTPEVQAQVYDYLTTRNADANTITDEAVRKAAIEAKTEINRVAREMVDKKVLSQESLDKYYDQYLPRMYLYYEATGRGIKNPNMGISAQEYLKARDEQLTPEERKMLGEIKNPAFLTYVALSRPQKDLALMEYFQQVKDQTGVNWIAPNSLVEFNGEMVTPYWLMSEANMIDKVADVIKKSDPDAAQMMQSRADGMRRIASPNIDRQKAIQIPDTYRRLPDSPRYGALRGAIIQKGIYDDIVGTMVAIPIGDKPFVQALLGDEQSLVVKANQIWKMSKITLNVPSQIRNAISNAIAMNVFGGVPLHRIAPLLARASKEVSQDGKYWQEAQKYGITGGTMSAAEMIKIRTELEQYLRKGGGDGIFGAFAAARIAAGKAIGAASDTYQAVEVRFKMAMFIHGRENGLSPSQAVDAANDALFDYTLVNPNIRWLRNSPIGLPFVTYYYKALPKLIETAYKHPMRFAPYVALMYAIPQMTMLALDIDDDDYEALRKSLPEYIRNKGSLFILPYKDENGRWQYIDTSYFFPWAAFTDPIVQAIYRQDPAGGAKEAAKLITPSGPIVTVLAGITTGRDPFTDKEIVDPRQTPQNKALALVSYVWNQAMPSMLAVDMVNPQNASGAIPRLYNDAFGSGTGLDKRGQPKPEFLADAARLFGANISPLEPATARALNINHQLAKIRASESLRSQVAKDQSLTPAARQREIASLNEKIREDYKKLQEYATETSRATALKK